MEFQGSDGVYTTVNILGSGSYGLVFRVKRKHDGKDFALKVFTSAANGLDDYELESKVGHLLKVNQECPPFITCVHDEGTVQITPELLNHFSRQAIEEYEEVKWDGLVFHFLVQELMDGDVDDLHEKGELTSSQIFDLMMQTLKGIHWLHERGFAHNDIKPQNIFYKRNGNSFEFKLGDLGAACFKTDSGQIRQCNAYATFLYAAPEILHSFYHPIRLQDAQLAEMWSLGVIYYSFLKKREDPLLDFYDTLPYTDDMLETVQNVNYDWADSNKVGNETQREIKNYFKNDLIPKANFSFPEIPQERMDAINQVVNGLVHLRNKRLTSKEALEILEEK